MPLVPGSESSWNFRSWEQKFLGAKVLGTFAPSSTVRDISVPPFQRHRLGATVSALTVSALGHFGTGVSAPDVSARQ